MKNCRMPFIVRNEIQPDELVWKLEQKHTFILNVITLWCVDCIERQARDIEAFIDKMTDKGLEVVNLVVQLHRDEFITTKHHRLTQQFGGAGYPRTVAVSEGVPLGSVVEAVTMQQLDEFVEEMKIINHLNNDYS